MTEKINEKIKGRSFPIVMDIMGKLLTVVVYTANVHGINQVFWLLSMLWKGYLKNFKLSVQILSVFV